MIQTFRSIFGTVYRVKTIIVLCLTIATIIVLSAYIGSNAFFSKDNNQSSNVDTTSASLMSRKDVQTEYSADESSSAPVQNESPAADPAASSVATESKPKVVCDEAAKAALIQARRTKSETEQSLHKANILAIQSSKSALSAVRDVVNEQLQTEDQRHASILTVIENEYLAGIPATGCSL